MANRSSTAEKNAGLRRIIGYYGVTLVSPGDRMIPSPHLRAAIMFFPPQQPMNRRQALCKIGGSFDALGLATMLAGEGLLAPAARAADNPLAPKAPMFKARASALSSCS